MSLIADALKAAQEEKSRQGSPDRAAAARRFLSSSVTVGGRKGEAVRWKAPEGAGVPRPVRIAAAVFALATLAAVAVVWLAPGGEPDAPVAAATAPVATRPPVAGAGGSPAAGDAPSPTSAQTDDPAPPTADREVDDDYLAAGGDEMEDGAEAGGSYPEPEPAPAPPRPNSIAARAARPIPPAATPAEAPLTTEPAREAAPGRFQLRLQPGSRDATTASAFEQGLAAQRRRDFPAAIQLYSQAVAQNPTNAEALNNLGATYQATGDLARARDTFRRALAVNPGFAAAWSNLAVVLGSLGETGEAQAALAEAIRLDPANHGAKVNLALQYQRQGLIPEARRMLEQVIGAAPQLAEAHYALGRLLEEQGDRAGAIRHFKLFLSTGSGRFVQLEPLVRQRVIQLGGNPDAR